VSQTRCTSANPDFPKFPSCLTPTSGIRSSKVQLRMEYEKVYVFEPEGERPAKRRRVEPQGLQTSWRRRRQAFDQVWTVQQQALDVGMFNTDPETLY